MKSCHLQRQIPWWFSSKESACNAGDTGRLGFSPWVGKIPGRRKWQPTPVFSPVKFHGLRSLAGYSPWGCKELVTTPRIPSFLSYHKDLQNRLCYEMTTESDSVSTISPTTYLMSGSSGLIERSLNLITTVGCVSLNLAKLPCLCCNMKGK